ncbi:Holliday junction resolvase RecU [Mycoplasmopsis ciconiae]|uniref:Holliday junction resolvase RecU n=1 Tax=Mycoplasmopsis ciconiae TaxID=561067 RepID=A0ABU7MLE9_9BACT|nr:Holliday junction resolvase RecU [Mycoplasmopsis ciconiae]
MHETLNTKNRGMLLESIINKSIYFYNIHKIAFIEKKSIPYKFSKKPTKISDQITQQNIFLLKSTVDYIGCYQGKYVCFEAKSSNSDRIEKGSIIDHQLNFLIEIQNIGGIAYYIFMFTNDLEFYLVDPKLIDKLTKSNKAINKKIIKKYSKKMELTFPGILDFLSYI